MTSRKQEIIERLQREFYSCDKHVLRINEALEALKQILPMTSESYAHLDTEQVRCLDQFIFRFSKLQDAMGAKLFRLVLEYLDEEVSSLPMRDILNRLERYRIIPDADEWNYVRELRNEISHDYPLLESDTVSVLNELFSKVEVLFGIYGRLKETVGNSYPSEEVEDSVMEKTDINYVKADLAVRHFEDAEVNGVPENEETPLMPFVVNRRWIIEVDIKKGCILDWPKGVSARVNYKVCDEGIYMIYDSDKRLIKRKEGYVPDIFGQDDASFGDYVSMSIDADGRIQNWKVTDAMLENLLS